MDPWLVILAPAPSADFSRCEIPKLLLSAAFAPISRFAIRFDVVTAPKGADP
jgi:hypothetical protein